MSKAPAIGIDLGTTYSCVAVYQNGKVEIIANEQGNKTTPSIVAFNEVERLVGETADEETIENPTNVIRDAKRLMGRSFDDAKVQENMKRWPFKVIAGSDKMPKVQVELKRKTETFTAEQISSMVLEKMKKIAEDYLGKPVKDAVITVPAYFEDPQRQATINAAKIAGLNVLRIIKEPAAAGFAYGLEKEKNYERTVLIFDLGGGTFDVSILSVKGQEFEVKAYGGDSHLGGEDFNNNLIDHFAQEFQRKTGINVTNDRSARARLRMACEKAKRTLTTTKNAKVSIDNLYGGRNFTSMISRAKFEALNAELFRKTIRCVEDALNSANLQKSSIDDIVLVGGSTRIPKVQKMLQTFFDGKEPCKSINPDEAVAYGAAVQAAQMSGKLKLTESKDFKFLDILPLSLGIEVQGGISSIIIPKNTVVPTSCTNNYTTGHDNVTQVRIKLLEGDRLMGRDNNLLGEMKLSGIPPMPRNIPEINVTFSIDANGTLHTKAVERSTGRSTEAKIQYDQKRPSQKELNRMIADAQRMRSEDQKQLEDAKARNELESYCLDLQSEVELNRRMSAKARAAVVEECCEVLSWLEEGRHNKRDCQLKKQELETFSRKTC